MTPFFMIRKLMLFIIVLIVAALVIIFGTAMYISAPRYQGNVSDHFNGKTFVNPGGIKTKGPKEVVQWMLNREKGKWREDTTRAYGPRPLAFEKDNIRITFVNHSTFLIQVGGLNILTDPIWSQRTSPFSWVGPRRMRAPGIRFEDLPKIHAVVISHNHYDHLDVPTLRVIAGAFHPVILTPLGVKQFLDGEGIAGASDVDWWDEMQINDSVSIQAVPAQHFSGRGILDRDATLWCGYVIKSAKGSVYFAGDTGYNDRTFKEIGERVGPIRVSLLPIGAYKPQWFMQPIHTSPEEAVKLHLDVKSEMSVGMHFGTFPLADDGLEDPPHDLKKALEKFGLDEAQFIVPREGEPIILE